jgi:hypothetical protein
MRDRVRLLWFVPMLAAGLAFGLIGDRRPFGEGMIAHPLVVFAAAAGVGLLVLRVVLQRPVPEVIPERALLIGLLLGLAAFLVGNWIGVRVLVAG